MAIKNVRFLITISFINILFIGISSTVKAESSKITLLHTNDLHSHFRGEKTPLGFGGIARLKTAIDKIRHDQPNTLLLDAGDWSEGNIYFTEDGGVETVRLMDRLGYDVAVLGNHDWLNGPDHLIRIFEAAKPKMTVVSANLNTEGYSQAEQFRKWVLPYQIRSVAGVKIAFIGLSTYEFVYDKFFSPITITEPFFLAKNLAESLKETGEADFVVAISHNSIFANKMILSMAPALDLVISGHQHKVLTKPIVVNRSFNNPGWVVETGSWGRYLGKVELVVNDGKVELSDYRLIQMDSSIPENPEILSKVKEIENRIEGRFGPIFHDHVGVNKMDLNREGINSPLGNIVMDAYLKTTGADFAMDSIKFINGDLHPGDIRSVDVFNAVPAVYNPSTEKTWTIKTLPVSGRTLKWLLYILYTSKKVSSLGLLNTAGLSFIYDPIIVQNYLTQTYEMETYFSQPSSVSSSDTMAIPPVRNILIQGKPLDLNASYKMATGHGMIEAIDFVDKNIYNGIPLDEMVDIGKESWRVLADYIRDISPITKDKVPRENRIQTLQADLGVHFEDIEWIVPEGGGKPETATIKARVKNYGLSDSIEADFTGGALVHILYNSNGNNLSIDPVYEDLAQAQTVKSLRPGESQEFSWEISLKKMSSPYFIEISIDADPSEVNLTNNEAVSWYRN